MSVRKEDGLKGPRFGLGLCPPRLSSATPAREGPLWCADSQRSRVATAKCACPSSHREWYGPRSPLLCPELQEDILDSLYALNGVAFNLDLQRPDLDEAWPMFSE